MQSDGQLSKLLALPSSQVSLPDTLPFPHAGTVQFASQPSMFLVEQKPCDTPVHSSPWGQSSLAPQMDPDTEQVPLLEQPVFALQVPPEPHCASSVQKMPGVGPPTHARLKSVWVQLCPARGPPVHVSGVSHSSGGVTTPLPHNVQFVVQPSPSFALPSSHSSDPSITPLPQRLIVVLVVDVLVTVVEVVVVDAEGQVSPSGRGM